MNLSNRWLWALKLTAGLFNGMATYLVFVPILKVSGRPAGLAYLSAFLAVLLIDVFFIWVLLVLEDTNLHVIRKLPWLVMSILLAIATVAVGLADEGWYAFIPRIGFVMLVLGDDFVVISDFWQYYFSREAVEQRLRDKQVKKRRTEMNRAYNKAIKKLRQDFETVQYERELKTIYPESARHSEESKVLIDKTEDEFYSIKSDGLEWECPKCHEVLNQTSLGQPFKSEHGLKIAIGKHICTKRNGHLEKERIYKTN